MQEDGAEDLAGDFPSLQELAAELFRVLDKAGVQSCIAMGQSVVLVGRLHD